MAYINTQTAGYPVTRAEIEAALPTAIWADTAPPAPYAVVQEALDPPTPGDGEVLVEGEPELVEGVWRRTWTAEAIPPRSLADLLTQVNADRDVRIDGGFLHTVDGVEYTFQSKPSDRENVMGMAMAAGAALASMAAADPPVNPVGNLRWFNPAADFNWITADNTLCPMDAIQTQALFAAGAGFKAACTFAARAYKDAMIADGTDAGAEAIYDSIVWPT